MKEVVEFDDDVLNVGLPAGSYEHESSTVQDLNAVLAARPRARDLFMDVPQAEDVKVVGIEGIATLRVRH